MVKNTFQEYASINKNKNKNNNIGNTNDNNPMCGATDSAFAFLSVLIVPSASSYSPTSLTTQTGI